MTLVSRQISTERILGVQSGGRPETMLANARTAFQDIDADDIEIVEADYGSATTTQAVQDRDPREDALRFLRSSDVGMARAVEDVIARQDALDGLLQAVIDKRLDRRLARESL